MHTGVMTTFRFDLCHANFVNIPRELFCKKYWTFTQPIDVFTLKAAEILILVMLRMNHEFMEYMRASYPDTPLSEFKTADTYVCAHGGVETLEDDEEDE